VLEEEAGEGIELLLPLIKGEEITAALLLLPGVFEAGVGEDVV
jgi:hypothetical protein